MIILKIGNISNEDQYFYLDKLNASKLEVAFNLTENGKTWSELGDVLYYFSIDNFERSCIKEISIYQKKDGTKILNWKVERNQFHYLRNLTNLEKIIKLKL